MGTKVLNSKFKNTIKISIPIYYLCIILCFTCYVTIRNKTIFILSLTTVCITVSTMDLYTVNNNLIATKTGSIWELYNKINPNIDWLTTKLHAYFKGVFILMILYIIYSTKKTCIICKVPQQKLYPWSQPATKTAKCFCCSN